MENALLLVRERKLEKDARMYGTFEEDEVAVVHTLKKVLHNLLKISCYVYSVHKAL